MQELGAKRVLLLEGTFMHEIKQIFIKIRPCIIIIYLESTVGVCSYSATPLING